MGIDLEAVLHRLAPKAKRQAGERLATLVQERRDIAFAYIHGSFLEDVPFHDIDLGVYLSDVQEGTATSRALELAHIFSRELQLPVDVRVLNFAPIAFLYHIIRGRLILERDEDLHRRVVEHTMQRYLDIKPIIRNGLKEAFGK